MPADRKGEIKKPKPVKLLVDPLPVVKKAFNTMLKGVDKYLDNFDGKNDIPIGETDLAIGESSIGLIYRMNILTGFLCIRVLKELKKTQVMIKKLKKEKEK